MTNTIYPDKKIDYEHITKHYLYWSWAMMKQRCINPKCKLFKYYGGIGIEVYPEWIISPVAFCRWIDENLRNETGRVFAR